MSTSSSSSSSSSNSISLPAVGLEKERVCLVHSEHRTARSIRVKWVWPLRKKPWNHLHLTHLQIWNWSPRADSVHFLSLSSIPIFRLAFQGCLNNTSRVHLPCLHRLRRNSFRSIWITTIFAFTSSDRHVRCRDERIKTFPARCTGWLSKAEPVSLYRSTWLFSKNDGQGGFYSLVERVDTAWTSASLVGENRAVPSILCL